MKKISLFKDTLKKAEQGDSLAQCDLGLRYDIGLGVIQDYQQAVSLYTKSAKQGNADAQCYLGWMYYLGEGVTQDYKQAFDWFTKSAEQGDADAQLLLGLMHDWGRGITQNHKQAYIWFSLAAAGGYQTAIEVRDIAAEQLTPQQLSEAQELAGQMQREIDKRPKLNL